MRKPYAPLIITLILLLSAAVQAQSAGEEHPVDRSLAEAILGVLTSEQADRFLAGADPATLQLEDGSTLADFIAVQAIGTGSQGAYHPLPNCQVVRTASSGRPSPIRRPTSVITAVPRPSMGTKASVFKLNARFVAANSSVPIIPTKMMNSENPATSARYCPPVGNP